MPDREARNFDWSALRHQAVAAGNEGKHGLSQWLVDKYTMHFGTLRLTSYGAVDEHY